MQYDPTLSDSMQNEAFHLVHINKPKPVELMISFAFEILKDYRERATDNDKGVQYIDVVIKINLYGKVDPGVFISTSLTVIPTKWH